MRWVWHVARIGEGEREREIDREEACTVFWLVNLKERDHLEDPGLDRRMILSLIFRKWDLETWTGSSMAQDRERWRALVNAVMNLLVP
jgi:hypothetical protein